MDLRTINQEYDKLVEQEVEITGYTKSNRFNGKIGFIDLTDGTDFRSAQIVYREDVADLTVASGIKTGDTIKVVGTVVRTPKGVTQKFEIQAREIILLKNCASDYPLQKKKHSPEFLREIAHLRAKTNLFQAVMRVRSEIAFAIHRFFQANNFVWVSTPLITSNDGEGAGETFTVTAKEPIFDQPASLTVTGQLQAEAYAQAFKKVYTFGPTFRAEKSHTSRHAAEFWMIEPEMAFSNLDDIINLAKTLLLSVIDHYLGKCSDEIDYFEKFVDPTIKTRLTEIRERGFFKVEYAKAIEVLQRAVEKKPDLFKERHIFFGMDLASEHERFLCEKIVKGPVFIYNYPKAIKAFYMKQNDDGQTVKAVDLLVPGIGELIGGSERESDYDKLVQRCQELNIPTEPLQWYLDLRKYGYYSSSGFGIGFERLIMYLTGVENIRDVIPFPRTPGNLKF